MASNIPDQTKKMEEVLECAICLEVYKKPKTLPCIHTFCENCIDTQIKPEMENGTKGIRCPKCQTFAKKGEYIKLYIVDEFVDVYNMATAKEKICQLCDDDAVKAEFRCLDCKLNICGGCQKRHNKTPNCRGHKYTACEDDPDFMVDHHVYCEEHNDQILDLYCTSCKKSICLRCKLTTHDKHDTETIDTALQQIIPGFEHSIRNIENAQEEIDDANAFLEKAMKKSSKMYDDIAKKYDQSLEDIIGKARAEHQQAINVIKEQKDKDVKSIKKAIEVNNEVKKSRKETVALAKASLQNAKGSSLMKALESGLMAKVKKEEAKPLQHQLVDVTNAVYEGSKIRHDEKLLGSTVCRGDKLLYQCPWKIRQVLCKFDDIIGKCLNKQDLAKVNHGQAYSMSLVDGNIWIPTNDANTNEIDVYKQDDGGHIKNITHNGLKRPSAVQQVNQHDVLAACVNGLHVLDTEGELQYTVMEGAFSSVSVHGNTAAALDQKKRQVVILTQVDNKWQQQHQFTLQDPDTRLKTLHLIGEIVYVCLHWQEKIYKYSISGELLAEYGTGIKGKRLGQFDYPYVNGSDREGSVIMCDSGNSRLQLLTTQGVWKEFTLNGVEWPRDLLVGNTLFVLWGGNKPRILSKFTADC